jgi:hypothetical protein
MGMGFEEERKQKPKEEGHERGWARRDRSVTVGVPAARQACVVTGGRNFGVGYGARGV